MKTNKILWTLWILFKRGHSMYLAFLVSFLNFITIQYSLLISKMPTLRTIFTSLQTFIAIFLLIYIPTAIILGWIDYRRGGMETMQQLNPWINDLSLALIYMMEGKKQKAEALLRRWTK